MRAPMATNQSSDVKLEIGQTYTSSAIYVHF